MREAGGRVSDFRDGEFQIASREVCASNGHLHPTLIQEFEQIFAGRELEPLPDPRGYSTPQK